MPLLITKYSTHVSLSFHTMLFWILRNALRPYYDALITLLTTFTQFPDWTHNWASKKINNSHLSLHFLHPKLLLNYFPLSHSPQILLRSLHHLDSRLLELTCSILFHNPYFDSIVFFHNPFSSLTNLHFHFPRKVLLKLIISFIPRPTLYVFLQIVSHFTQAILLLSPSQPTKTQAVF